MSMMTMMRVKPPVKSCRASGTTPTSLPRHLARQSSTIRFGFSFHCVVSHLKDGSIAAFRGDLHARLPEGDRGFQVPAHHRRRLRRAGSQTLSRAVLTMARSPSRGVGTSEASLLAMLTNLDGICITTHYAYTLYPPGISLENSTHAVRR